jgi:hypothetical protein
VPRCQLGFAWPPVQDPTVEEVVLFVEQLLCPPLAATMFCEEEDVHGTLALTVVLLDVESFHTSSGI